MDSSGRRLSCRWTGFLNARGFLIVGAGMAWFRWAERMRVPGGGDGLRPAPGGIEAYPGLSGAGTAPRVILGSQMQDTPAERRDSTSWLLVVAVESDGFGTTDQICCRRGVSSQPELASKALKGKLRRPVAST